MSNVIKDSLSRQNAITRKNLLAVSRLSIQTLCDESGVTGVIDDNSEHLVNFCNIIETLLCHRYKLISNKQLGTCDGIVYWEFVKQACKSVPYSCIEKISEIDDVKTTRGKGRAWIRMALMEKRLSEYLSVALMEDSLVRRFYGRGSFMNHEEAHILANVLSALNSVDFSLCLRNNTFDLPIVYTIDFTSFLKYPISDKQLDLEEALIRLERNRAHNDASSTCSGHTSNISEREPSIEEELAKLKRSLKMVVDQKAYLEEILHLKDAKCTELTQQLLEWDEQVEKDKALSDSIIVELQQQLAESQFQNRQLHDRLTDGLQDRRNTGEMEPVLASSRYSITLHRPTEGVDVVAQMDRNGYCSRSSSDLSVKRSTSDQSVKHSTSDLSVKRSTETILTRTSSQSGSSRARNSSPTARLRHSSPSTRPRHSSPSTRPRNNSPSTRPRNKSRAHSNQKIAGAVENILPSEKERLLFTVHKRMQKESFITFGDS